MFFHQLVAFLTMFYTPSSHSLYIDVVICDRCLAGIQEL